MSVTFNIVRSRPKIILQLGAILFLPWVWAAFVMPLWASGVCAALWLVAFRFAVHLFVVPRFKRHRAGDSSLTPEQIMEMRAPTTGMFTIDPQTVRGDLDSLHNGLRRRSHLADRTRCAGAHPELSWHHHQDATADGHGDVAAQAKRRAGQYFSGRL